MSKNLSLGDRMKSYYEVPPRSYLPRRTNAIIRLDGIGFSGFTRGLDKPYDASFVDAMNKTAIFLCEKIQGAKCAFVQSDEITIWVTDYDTNDTQAWLGYEVQKMVSHAAGWASARFNEVFKHKTKNVLAAFDARVFSIPFAEEVVNCFLWRQQDCTRNSIAMLAQCLYSHKELHGVDSKTQENMIYLKRDELRPLLAAANILDAETLAKESLQWSDLPAGLKRGRLILHKETRVQASDTSLVANPKYKVPADGVIVRHKWVAEGAPIFSKDRQSILCLTPGIATEEEEDIDMTPQILANNR